jgi:hypothetical protein
MDYDLRAAAERLADYDLAVWQGPTGDCTDMRAAIKLARAYLAEHPADDAEAVIWTDERCFELNALQHDHTYHGYTCGNDSRHRPLIATRQGWRCADCDYRQGWAHNVIIRKQAPQP